MTETPKTHSERENRNGEERGAKGKKDRPIKVDVMFDPSRQTVICDLCPSTLI